MTNEEAKVFLDNLKICIEEHPIVADWLVEIADRKTESNSEIPNNCEDKPQTNADQHIQSVESVESVGSNLEPFRVDELQTERNE